MKSAAIPPRPPNWAWETCANEALTPTASTAAASGERRVRAARLRSVFMGADFRVWNGKSEDVCESTGDSVHLMALKNGTVFPQALAVETPPCGNPRGRHCSTYCCGRCPFQAADNELNMFLMQSSVRFRSNEDEFFRQHGKPHMEFPRGNGHRRWPSPRRPSVVQRSTVLPVCCRMSGEDPRTRNVQ